MNIMITCGLGYIGSHTVIKSAQKGNKVFIIDNLKNSNISNLTKIKRLTKKNVFFYNIDILNFKKIKKILIKKKIDIVLHLAALKDPNESYLKEHDYFKTNVLGSNSVLQAVIEAGVNKFIFASSASVYGNAKKMPISESFKLQFNNSPYAQSKILVENYLRDISKIHKKLNICILRYFNPAGAYPSGCIGELSNKNSKNIFPMIAKSVKKKKKFYIYKSLDKKTDGSGQRDFVHIMDVADANYKLLKNFHKIKGLEIFNIGSGKSTSVNGVVKIIKLYLNKSFKISYAQKRKGDVDINYSNINKFKKKFNWKPKKNIYDICTSFLKWEKINF